MYIVAALIYIYTVHKMKYTNTVHIICFYSPNFCPNILFICDFITFFFVEMFKSMTKTRKKSSAADARKKAAEEDKFEEISLDSRKRKNTSQMGGGAEGRECSRSEFPIFQKCQNFCFLLFFCLHKFIYLFIFFFTANQSSGWVYFFNFIV